MILSAIVAMDRNRVIGYQNKMPWHLSADLKYFKRVTMGHPIIMGRKTHESIGKPLPGRLNIVISRQGFKAPAEVQVVNSLQAALDLVQDQSEVFITGGQQIFQQALPLIQRIYMTQIDHEFSGDTWFPELNKNDWELIDEEKHFADEQNPYNYSFLKLFRKF